MSTQAKSDTDEALTSGIGSPRLLFASIWAYALASGFLAYGLTEVVTAVTRPSSLRLSLQLGTISVTAVAAGFACERTVNTFCAFIASRRRN
jgi:hypothetical protein